MKLQRQATGRISQLERSTVLTDDLESRIAQSDVVLQLQTKPTVPTDVCELVVVPQVRTVDEVVPMQATHRDEAVGRIWSIGENNSQCQIFLDKPQLDARLAVLNSRGIVFSGGVLMEYSNGVATRWLGER